MAWITSMRAIVILRKIAHAETNIFLYQVIKFMTVLFFGFVLDFVCLFCHNQAFGHCLFVYLFCFFHIATPVSHLAKEGPGCDPADWDLPTLVCPWHQLLTAENNTLIPRCIRAQDRNEFTNKLFFSSYVTTHVSS